MYVRRICLENICGIRELDLRLFESGQRLRSAVLIGENATGKSSVLRAIVLGLASQTEANALLAEPFGSPFVHSAATDGIIELYLVDQHGGHHVRKTTIRKVSDDDERVSIEPDRSTNDKGPLVVAFGAGRSNEGAESSRMNYTIVDSAFMLFNYEGTFVQPELTLRRLNDYVGSVKYQAIMGRIREALKLGAHNVLEFRKGGGVFVSGPGAEDPMPLQSWADGYRVTLNWILDIYAWAMRFEGSIDSQGYVQGILVIDEIEQHLHPSMQRHIVKDLKRLFPKLQILMSSHSPLVVQGISGEEIVSLYRENGKIKSAHLRDYTGFSVEDLLTATELFRTPPYAIEIQRLRERYAELIGKTALSGDEEAELSKLGRELASLRMASSVQRRASDEA